MGSDATLPLSVVACVTAIESLSVFITAVQNWKQSFVFSFTCTSAEHSKPIESGTINSTLPLHEGDEPGNACTRLSLRESASLVIRA